MQLLPWSMMFTFFKAKIHFLHILRIFKVYFSWIFVHFRPFYLNFGLFFLAILVPWNFLIRTLPLGPASQPASSFSRGGGGAIFSSKMGRICLLWGFSGCKTQKPIGFRFFARYQVPARSSQPDPSTPRLGVVQPATFSSLHLLPASLLPPPLPEVFGNSLFGPLFFFDSCKFCCWVIINLKKQPYLFQKKCPTTAKCSQNWPEMAQSGSKWSKMVQNGWLWLVLS